MSLDDSILDNFDSPTPAGQLRAVEENVFEVTETSSGAIRKTVYSLEKAPIETLEQVDATVNGRSRILTPGDGIETRDIDGDGEPDAVAFTEPDDYPDDNTEFTVTYLAVPVIDRFTGVHTEDLFDYRDRVDTAVSDARLNTSTGRDLDRLGAIYGVLGARQKLGDDAYRAKLRALRQAVAGRGTKPSVRGLVAQTLDVEESEIDIIENFEEQSYELQLSAQATSTLTDTLDVLLELADPSGVELIGGAALTVDSAAFTYELVEITATETESGLGSGELGDETL